MELDINDELKIIDLVGQLDNKFLRSARKNFNIGKQYNINKFTNYINSNNNCTHSPLNNIQTNAGNTVNLTHENALSSTNSNINNNIANFGSPSTILAASGINTAVLSGGYMLGSNLISKTNDHDGNSIKALDFCYSDLSSKKFSLIDVINLSVTVISYAANVKRAHQMLIILDVVIPRYMEQLKLETDISDSPEIVKKEYEFILQISVALKTMINSVDAINRNFIGSRNEILNSSYKYVNHNSHRSPSIIPDEDSIRYNILKTYLCPYT